MSEESDGFPGRIRFPHRRGGLAQDRLALLPGVSIDLPGRRERPDGPRPSHESLRRPTVVLETNSEFLLGLTDDPEPYHRG